MTRNIPTYEELSAENERLKSQLAEKSGRATAFQDQTTLFSILAQNSTDNMFVQDIELRYEYVCNPQLGWKSEDIIGKTDLDLLHKEDAERLIELKQRVLKTGKVETVVTPVIAATGQAGYFSGLYLPRFDETGKINGLIGYFRNIDDIIHSEHELNLFFELVPDMVVIASIDGYFKKINKAWETVLGFTSEELLAQPFAEFIHPDDLLPTYKEIEKQLNNKPTLSFTNRYRCKGGGYKWLEWVAIPSPDKINLFAAARDITEKKQVDEVMYQSEERIRQITTSSGIWVWEVDQNGLYTYVSESEESVLGYKPEELIGKKYFYDFFAPETKSQLKEAALAQLNEKAGFSNFINTNIHKEGYEVVLETNGFPILDDEEKLLGYRGSDRDISERVRIEKTLKESEEKFKQAFETNPDAITINRLSDGKYVSVNQGFTQIFHYQPEEVLGRTSLEIGIWRSAEDRLKFTSLVQETGKIENFETTLVGSNGELFACLVSSSVMDYDGAPHILSTTKDITGRKMAEEAIAAASAKLKASLDSLNDAFFISDSEGHFIEFNDAFATFHKFRDRNECSLTLTEYPDILDVRFEDGETVPLDQWAIPRALRGEKNTNQVFLMKRKDTGEQWVGSFSFAPVLSKENLIVGAVVSARDITAQKQMETALINSEKEFRLLAESMPQIVWVTNAEGQNTYCNQQWVDYTGLSLRESAGDGWNIPFHPDDRKSAWEAWQHAVKNNGIYSIEARLRKFDGSYRWWLIRGTPVLNEAGRIEKWFGTCTDIHQIKITEDQLIEAKIKAEESDHLKSALLSNMSHEIRTPMNAIMGFSNLLPEANESEKGLYASIIQESSTHLLKLLDDVILLSRLQSEKTPLLLTHFSPADLVEYVYNTFQHADLNHGLEILKKIPIDHKELIINSDENKIRQVLLCLVSNAVKYTFDGSVEIGFNWINQSIKFYVKDTGIGISEEEQPKIFETFFRGEMANFHAIRGNGLGLSIAQKLVASLGGTITVESHPGKGSCFQFFLPLNEIDLLTNRPSISQKMNKDLSTTTILITEDEQMNYKLLELILKNKVGHLDHANNGQEAIELASRNNYDLVLMDIKMPVMGGLEATKILKARFPHLPIIAQTAFILPEERQNALNAGCDDFLPKPIDKQLLFEMINKYCLNCLPES